MPVFTFVGHTKTLLGGSNAVNPVLTPGREPSFGERLGDMIPVVTEAAKSMLRRDSGARRLWLQPLHYLYSQFRTYERGFRRKLVL